MSRYILWWLWFMVTCLRGSRGAKLTQKRQAMALLTTLEASRDALTLIIANKLISVSQQTASFKQHLKINISKHYLSLSSNDITKWSVIINNNKRHQSQLPMFGQTCTQDTDCQFMYSCINGLCSHQGIFPLSAYTIIIYFLTGVASCLCNASGNSMGLFKMLILVLALNYELGEATGLTQAMVVGTSLPNFMSIIFKRHPKGHTSLVNYNLLQLIIPCCLLGSVLGAIAQTMIPKIAQLIILFLVFGYFTLSFLKKLRSLFKIQSDTISPLPENKQPFIQQNQQVEQGLKIQNFTQSQAVDRITVIDNIENDPQCVKIREYQASYHFKDIFRTFAIFVVFQLLSFFFQGKFPFYQIDKCSIQFFLGLVALCILVLSYVYWLRLKFKKTFAVFKKYDIQQDIYLDQKKEFFTISIGAFIAGFIHGTLGLGAGTCLMMIFLSLGIDTTVGSAASGYQYLFTGSGSLLQFYINGQVEVLESLWFFAICLIIGGIATLGLFHLISKLDKTTVNKFLVSIILGLCLMSMIFTIPTGLRIYNADGWEGLSRIKFHCE